AKVTKFDVTLNLLGFLAVAVVMAFGIMIVYNIYYETEAVTQLKKENKELQDHYIDLKGDLKEVNQVISALEDRDDNIYRKIYEAEPLGPTIRQAGHGGTQNYKRIMESGLADKALVLSTANEIAKIKRKALIQNQSFDELIRLANNRASSLAAIPSIQPIENEELTNLVSGFGMRINPFHKARVPHEGIDFAAPRGTPVMATGNGTIKFVKNDSDLQTGYGNYVEIDHGHGYVSKYAHLRDAIVKQGADVKRGDIIGYVGSTGGSTAPHVHYEIMLHGKKIDPVHYLMQGINENDYKKLLKLSTRENQSFD
ncbi:MAG: M23 family metallopeptidase, partial [Bacteroidota bacterium]